MQKISVKSYCPIVTRTSGGFFPKLTAFSKCERAMSTFFVCEWRRFPSCRCVRAWIAGDGWNWNTDWRHWIHCLILGGLDVLKVSAKPKRPVYEASWVPAAIVAAILFLFGLELQRSCQRLREIKRYIVYGNTVCYLKFDTLWNAWSRVWSRSRVTFPLFVIGLRRSWKRKTIQYGGISQFWEDLGLTSVSKVQWIRHLCPYLAFDHNLPRLVGFGCNENACGRWIKEFWSEDGRAAHWQSTKNVLLYQR